MVENLSKRYQCGNIDFTDFRHVFTFNLHITLDPSLGLNVPLKIHLMYLRRIFFLTLFLFSFSYVWACDIEISVDPASKKKVYHAGDVVVLVVTVEQSHRKCELKISETKFDVSGLQILAATEWKDENGTYVRKLKVKVLRLDSGKSVLKVSRICSKDDNISSIVLKTE